MDLFAPSHLLVIMVICLIVFGPSKLGDLGGAMGKTIKDFKKAVREPEEPKVVRADKAEDGRMDEMS